MNSVLFHFGSGNPIYVNNPIGDAVAFVGCLIGWPIGQYPVYMSSYGECPISFIRCGWVEIDLLTGYMYPKTQRNHWPIPYPSNQDVLYPDPKPLTAQEIMAEFPGMFLLQKNTDNLTVMQTAISSRPVALG